MDSFAWVCQPVEEKENSEFNPFKLHLKIDYPAYVEGLGKYICLQTEYLYVLPQIKI